MTEKSEVAKIAAELMETVLQKMSLSGELLTEENEEEVQILVRGRGLGLLIGKHGRTLEALQFILSIVANKNAEIKKRVSLDIEDYKKRRVEDLEALAFRFANKAVSENAPVVLKPMKASERRIIHLALKDHSEVVTESEGEEPSRRVIIFPKQAAK